MNHIPPFAMLSLLDDNILRFSNFPPEAVDWVIEAATVGWPRLTATRQDQKTIVFHANVWSPSGAAETIYSRRMMLHILRCLQSHGYYLFQGIDITGDSVGKDVLLFEQREPTTTRMMAISVNANCLLRLIGAPDEVVAITKACLDYHFTPKGVLLSPKVVQGTTEFQLDGCPWESDHSSRSTHGRLMIAHLFAQLSACGWRLYGSIKQTGNQTGGDYTRRNPTKDTFYFTNVADALFAAPLSTASP
ncbi:hypothetical protein AaE_010462 [Aphanomyces astaci]|uniref:Uncharacterized protein n=1 Tax=Aphanomyces astaci TaxID=112090 RepID=A0A6A4ZMG9_APHAT|nr:hypothetical protein AaE_010462 [Aphanomyces astaci]